MIARAAYFVGVPLWEGTIIDELSGHYDRRTHRLARPDDPFAVLPMTVDLNRLAGHVVVVGTDVSAGASAGADRQRHLNCRRGGQP